MCGSKVLVALLIHINPQWFDVLTEKGLLELSDLRRQSGGLLSIFRSGRKTSVSRFTRKNSCYLDWEIETNPQNRLLWHMERKKEAGTYYQ